MNDIDDAHEESKGSHPDTIQLLASLFEESKESKIKRVRVKTRPKSGAKKSAVVKQTKDVQQRTPKERRVRQDQLSGSKIKARAIKDKTQARKPAAPEVISVKAPRIKAHEQARRHKTVAEKRQIPEIRKHQDKMIPESRIVKKAQPAFSDVYVHAREVSSQPPRRSRFGSTTLSIGLPFVIGILVIFLGTRYAPLDFFKGDQGIVLVKKEMVEHSAPKKQDLIFLNTSTATVGTAKQRSEDKTLEPLPIGPEKETIKGLPAPKEPDIPVSETPQEITITAKQPVLTTNPEPSMSTQNKGETEITKTFQRDASKSYPYSIYFGSYKHIDGAQKVIASFREKGLSPYWVRVDLGEKGVWYRVLAGHFQTKDEVKAFIKEHRITEGKPRHVLYANFIGPYSSDEELNKKNLSLLELGYCPYVIKGINGESLFFTGAFYHKADAEREHIELASKGIQTRLVKR